MDRHLLSIVHKLPQPTEESLFSAKYLHHKGKNDEISRIKRRAGIANQQYNNSPPIRSYKEAHEDYLKNQDLPLQAEARSLTPLHQISILGGDTEVGHQTKQHFFKAHRRVVSQLTDHPQSASNKD
jgi:hypothetical protein